MERERVLILIDGSNFYFKLKDLKIHNLLNFNFSEFSKFLAKGDKVIESRYYVGKIRQDKTKKTQKLFDDQQKLIGRLKKSGYKYCFGYLLKNNGIYHEKGVDIQMAVDILVATYEKLCTKVLLVSSDTDLLPAIKKAKLKGLKIQYIGFSHKPSVAMVANCKESLLLTKEDLRKFISK